MFQYSNSQAFFKLWDTRTEFFFLPYNISNCDLKPRLSFVVFFLLVFFLLYLFIFELPNIQYLCWLSAKKAMTIAALHCINAPDNCPRHNGSYQGIAELQWFTQRSWSDSSALSLYQKFRWRSQKVWSMGTKVL